MKRPAVFVDRDGTINVEVDYLADPRRVALLPGAAAALRALADAGFALVVVTNQSGIARGLLDQERLAAIHAELDRRLEAEGARVDAYYSCPHHPTYGEPPYRADCDCRKPRPGLLQRATAELDLDLGRSWVIGDSLRDLEAGAALGVPGILVGTGKGQEQRARLGEVGPPQATFATDLAAAAAHVLDAVRS